jgi:hypothetical protein
LLSDIVAAVRLALLAKTADDHHARQLFSGKELPGCVSRVLRVLQSSHRSGDVLFPSTMLTVFPIFTSIFEFGNSENVVHAFAVLER